MHRVIMCFLSLLVCPPLWAGPLETSPYPVPRPETLQTSTPLPAGWERWRDGIVQRALQEGVSRATVEAVTPLLIPRPTVVRQDRNQAEFAEPIWVYLDRFVSPSRVEAGQTHWRNVGDTLARVDNTFGVDAPFVLAIWGVETGFGRFMGDTPVFQALATLAFDGRRQAFFERELMAALQIVDRHGHDPSQMSGSWAGAMGHTQFMPTSYLAYAHNISGDRGGNIWSEDPSDALASTAAFLRRYGWQQGVPSFVEVRVPDGFDWSKTGREHARSADGWGQLGVQTVQGRALPPSDRVRLWLPAGASGPVLALYPNFDVIRRYNPSDSYALAVSLLAQKAVAGVGLQAPWPTNLEPLTRNQVQDVQRRLTDLGFDTQGVDGIAGPNTQNALRRWQTSRGLTPDGFLHKEVWQRLQN